MDPIYKVKFVDTAYPDATCSRDKKSASAKNRMLFAHANTNYYWKNGQFLAMPINRHIPNSNSVKFTSKQTLIALYKFKGKN